MHLGRTALCAAGALALGLATAGTATVGMATGGSVGGITGPSTATTRTTVAAAPVVGIGSRGMATSGTTTVGMAAGGTVGEHIRHERRIIRQQSKAPALFSSYPAFARLRDNPWVPARQRASRSPRYRWSPPAWEQQLGLTRMSSSSSEDRYAGRS
jgi:hypothetical protein